ncbi:MAG TPA: PIG-L deacetylase family protein [Vicinamibacterales bacterium]|jgi:LmbE family N-acetylglucosaminyl deacetylase
MIQQLSGRTLVAILAHPDDESLACGGTLARAAAEGVRVVLICLTRGEGGSSWDPALLKDSDLGAVRARELNEAAATLGLADVVLLSYPDGELPWADAGAIEADIRQHVERIHADAVITFGADGLYWHPDHIAVHDRTVAALEALSGWRPGVYCVTMPPGTMRTIVEEAGQRSGETRGPWGLAPDAFGAYAQAPDLSIDVSAFAVRKLQALRCHRTQIGPDNPLAQVPLDRAGALLGVEHFHCSRAGEGVPPLLERLAMP